MSMKKIIRYNPTLTTLNMGDFIIYDSILNQMGAIFKDAFNVDVSTHLPISYSFTRLLENADYKFVCGTNLLCGRLNWLYRPWDINIFNAKKLGPAILIGAGWWQYNSNPNHYTKSVYKKILSREYMHSVRDNYTKQMLNSIGFDNVICTACPTMWSLTKEHCKQIPTKKAANVVTTITDYNKDADKDREMLNILLNEYETVYLWLQGVYDYNYIKDLELENKVKLIPPTLSEYDNILSTGDVDYIGTRLHGGVRALQKKVRSIIIGVDNRAQEKKKDFNINVLDRNDIKDLKDMIYSDIRSDITIPTEEINRWKAQFDLA